MKIDALLYDQIVASWEELVNFDRLRKYRIGRVTSALKEAGLDGLIAFKSDSVRYASSIRPLTWEAGYQTRNMVVVDAKGNICLFVASGDYQRVVQNDPWLGNVKPLASMEDAGISSRVVNDQLVPQLKEMGLAGGKLGVDSTTFYTLDFIRRALGETTSIEDGDQVMKRARAIKSADEIRLISGAAGIVDGGLAEAVENLVPGRTENEVAGAALRAMYALGTEWMPINPVVFSDGRGSFRRFSTPKSLSSDGKDAIVSLSAMNDGYCAEATRTFGVGESTRQSKSRRRGIRESFDSMVRKLSPGTRLEEEIANNQRAAAPSAGKIRVNIRGAGLSLVDLPIGNNLVRGGGKGPRLEENNVIVLEVGVDDPKAGPIQISDTIHITNAGPVMLTRFQEDNE